jgi:hypothetical protein
MWKHSGKGKRKERKSQITHQKLEFDIWNLKFETCNLSLVTCDLNLNLKSWREKQMTEMRNQTNLKNIEDCELMIERKDES